MPIRNGKKNKLIGESFTNTKNETCEVVEFIGGNWFNVIFPCGYESRVSRSQLQNGQFKGKYTVHMWGFNDMEQGSYDPVVYSIWTNMILRVKEDREYLRGDAYAYVVICEEWRTFSGFNEWAVEQDYQDKQINNDLISGDIYSPSTCVFIPSSLNGMVPEKGYLPESGYRGVVERSPGRFMAQVSIDNKSVNLGTHKTAELAYTAVMKNLHSRLQEEWSSASQEVKDAIEVYVERIELRKWIL